MYFAVLKTKVIILPFKSIPRSSPIDSENDNFLLGLSNAVIMLNCVTSFMLLFLYITYHIYLEDEIN